jgi:hypothetical protein
MISKWQSPDTFHLGINMAGAVSAGAYTAGVLDFLTEALDEWYKEKSAPNPAVPMHNLCIEAFSGASAGGMCAAIAAAMVQGPFEHIHNPQAPPTRETTNKFYESWVNKIDIQWLLQDADLANGGKVVSLLDSTIIDQIADYALTPGSSSLPPYISKSLTLFLTLTNVRGVPYSLNGDAPGSAEEEIGYYADWLQFETVGSMAEQPASPGAKPLPPGANTGAWPLLKEAAKATGAFPLFLAPRQIARDVEDYCHSPWEPLSDPRPDLVKPHWDLKLGDTFTTLNVDGGVTDNDPFQLTHDYLAIHNPKAVRNTDTGELQNPSGQDDANSAVLTVAPFPADTLYNKNYDFAANSSIFGMLPNLFTALISQSRFQGESLTAVIDTRSYSRFVLAPSDDARKGQEALQCAALSAFGGFFERGFRAHDYQLGRRNCQKFLLDTFRLRLENPIVAAGLVNFSQADKVRLAAKFAPSSGTSDGTLPIIPLCGTAVSEVLSPARATITSARLAHILNWIVDRLHAVAKPLLEDSIGANSLENWAARSALDTLISTWAKNKIRDVLMKELDGVIAG